MRTRFVFLPSRHTFRPKSGDRDRFC
uniref:Uncharacterized protein n=1 Tax=Anopheles arabiensis TaxID=7173 RepID=A0A182IF77_ANOAR